MRAYHNTRDQACRIPYGAVERGGAVSLAIEVRDEVPASCDLRVWVDGEGETLYPMEGTPLDGGMRFSVELEPEKPAILWYSFALRMADGRTLWYCPAPGRVGGEGVLRDWLESSFQMTVYEPREVEPDWIDGGIVYQIFPDRFARGADWRERVDEALRLHPNGPGRALVEDWDTPPRYRRNEDATIREWDFYGGTLSGVREKLGYLSELGVTALYLNPIFEAASWHRYDTGDYLQVDPMLGDEDEFRALCDEARALGISVILDGVFNHAGRDSRYFNAFGNYDGVGAAQGKDSPYRTWFKIGPDGEYLSWWGVKDLPDFEENDQGYRDFVFGEDGPVRHWLRAGASGWRLDVVDELPDDFVVELTAAAREERPDALVLGEVWEDASHKVSYDKLRRYFLGDELDCVMNYHLRDALLGYVLGFASAGDLNERIESIRENYPPQAFARALNMLGSHDTERVFTILGGAPAKDSLSDDERAAYRLPDNQRGLAKGRLWLSALLQMTLPGIPCIYYGDEAGVEGYADPYNRSTYPWGHEDRDCQTIYRNAAMLRRTLPMFRDGDIKLLDLGDDVFGFSRTSTTTGESAVVLVNRSLQHVHEVTVPMMGERVDDVVNGHEVPVEDGRARVMLRQLGSTVLYFHGSGLGLEPERGSNVICHITSVPNDGLPGTLGAPAHAFCDWLADCGQKYWQILPVNPTDRFGSPYAGLSAFAGNTALLEGGERDIPTSVGKLGPREREVFDAFCAHEADWLDPYVAFMAIKDLVGEGVCWQEWPKRYRSWSPKLLDDSKLARGIEHHRLAQFAFQLQLDDLLGYAHRLGIHIVGDMPMYVSADSSDVWAHPEIFQLDDEGRPAVLAGAPPDAFAEEGQLWGNPVYRWDVLAASGYDWWMRRFERALALYDYVRLDHFLGFSAFYAIERGANAKEGTWRPGPGRALFEAAYERFGDLPFIAEDLGVLTPAARSLVTSCGFYGMDVMQFAQGDVRAGWRCVPGKLAYVATHDTQTLVGWCEKAYGQAREDAERTARDLLRVAAETTAPICVYQLQDVCLLGDEARMNVPGTSEGNWTWCADAADLERARDYLRKITEESDRA